MKNYHRMMDTWVLTAHNDLKLWTLYGRTGYLQSILTKTSKLCEHKTFIQLVRNIPGRTWMIKGSMIQISLLEMFREKRGCPWKLSTKTLFALCNAAQCLLLVIDRYKIDFCYFQKFNINLIITPDFSVAPLMRSRSTTFKDNVSYS